MGPLSVSYTVWDGFFVFLQKDELIVDGRELRFVHRNVLLQSFERLLLRVQIVVILRSDHHTRQSPSDIDTRENRQRT